MKKNAAIVVLILSMLFNWTLFYNKPVDASTATTRLLHPNAQRVLNYLKSFGNGKYLSGQVGNWHTYIPELPDTNDSSNWVKKVENATSYRPAVQTVTYALATELWQHNNPPYWPLPWEWNAAPSNQALKDIWDRGGIPSAFIVWGNPQTYSRGLYGPCDVDLIFATGTNEVKTNFYRQMDYIADQMQWLKDRNVPVLFHPFVELDDSGKWHASDGIDNAIALYRLVYDYFVNKKGLNNLIWVYYVGYIPRITLYYPGDEYVDVIGISCYMKYNETLSNLIPESDWNWMVNKRNGSGKILALSEVGLRNENEPYADAMKLLQSFENKYKYFSYFSFWKDNWFTVISNNNGAALLGDTKIIVESETTHKQLTYSSQSLSNSGFESGTTGWACNTILTSVNSPINSGTYAAKVSNRTQPWHGIQQSIKNCVDYYGQGKYYVEAYVRHQAGKGSATGRVSIIVNQNGQWTPLSNITGAITDTGYVKISGTLDYFPQGTVQDVIVKVDTTDSINDLFIDDLTLKWVATEPKKLKELSANSGFESGTSPWVGWGTSISQSPICRSGQSSMLVTRGTWSAVRQDIKQLLKQNGNGEYNISAFVKATSDSNNIYFSLVINGDGVNKGFVATNTGYWTQVSASYTVSNVDEINEAYIYIIDYNPPNGQNNNNYYVDDFSITKTGLYDEPSNLDSNPSFESGTSPWIGWGTTISQSSVARSGDKSMLVTRGGWSAVRLDIKQLLKDNGNGDYYISASVKATSDPNNIYISLFINGTGINKGFIDTNLNSWIVVNGLYTIQDVDSINEAYIYIVDYNLPNGQNNNNYYVDDFSIVKYK